MISPMMGREVGKYLPAVDRTCVALLMAALLAIGTGCAATEAPTKAPATAPSERLASEEIEQRVQAAADRFIGGEAQAYQQLEESSNNPEVRAWARTTKIGQALAALAIATGPNPYENAVDLVVMISLKRASLEANEAKMLLTPQEAAPLLDIYRRAETTAWELANRALTPAQVEEAKVKIAEFLRENPDLRYSGFVRFTDLLRNHPSDETKSAGSLLSLVDLDPLAKLDPATRELHETRTMVARAAYFFQRMPLILQWETHQAGADLLDQPQTLRVVTATTQFAATANRIADTAAGYPEALSKEREAAINQLQQAVDAQRKAIFSDLDNQRREMMSDLDAQQNKFRDLLSDVRSSLDRTGQTGDRLKTAMGNTVDATEAAAQRVVRLAFWLGLAFIGCVFAGVLLLGLFFRRMLRPQRDPELAHAT
jgi:hypothetical protein